MLSRERVGGAPPGEAAVVVALGDVGRLLVVLPRADVDELHRQPVRPLVVAVLARRPGGERGVEEVVDRLPLALEVAGEIPGRISQVVPSF